MKSSFRYPLLLVLALISTRVDYAANDGASTSASKKPAWSTSSRLPLSFTANQGQADTRIAYVAHGDGYAIGLGRAKADVTLTKSTSSIKNNQVQKDLLELSFPGAKRVPDVSGLERLQGDSNYLIGNDASKWHASVPNYARIKYGSVYPGVDLIFYGNQQQLEFDLIVAAGADANAVKMSLATPLSKRPMKLEVNTMGDLIAKETGRIVLHKPMIYQMAQTGDREKRQIVRGGFVVGRSGRVRFHIDAYDRTRELVIDPTLAYSTYFGGNGISAINAIAVDAAGDAYVLGISDAADFPVTSGALQPDNTGQFVSKLNPSGTAVLYSTFFGTVGETSNATAIAVDTKGHAYVSGSAGSGFPTTKGAYQPVFTGSSDSFVAKLNDKGTAFIYATYLNGPTDKNGQTTINTIKADQNGSAYVAGSTDAKDFPTTKGVFQPTPADPDRPGPIYSSFLTKFSPDGSTLDYSTFLGGDGVAAAEVALDIADNAYVLGNVPAGSTSKSSNFRPTNGAFSKVGNAFLAKINAAGSKLVYYTLLREFNATSLAVDQESSTYLSGSIAAKGAPTYPGLAETPCDLCQNAFVIKLNPAASHLVYSAFLGESLLDPTINPIDSTFSQAYSIAVDASGSVYVTGLTDDPEYPLTADAYQKFIGDGDGAGGGDVFLTKLDPSGSKVAYSTYLGGDGDDEVSGIGLDAQGDAILAGFSESGDFPTTPNPFQPGTNAFTGFISKFSFDEPFCSLKANLLIATDPDKQQGLALDADFALGSSAPLDLATEPLTVTIGNQAITIPAGKLTKSPSGYFFDGTLDGIELFLLVHEVFKESGACQTPAYQLFAAGSGGTYDTVANPIEVTITAGGDSGSTMVKPMLR